MNEKLKNDSIEFYEKRGFLTAEIALLEYVTNKLVWLLGKEKTIDLFHDVIKDKDIENAQAEEVKQ